VLEPVAGSVPNELHPIWVMKGEKRLRENDAAIYLLPSSVTSRTSIQTWLVCAILCAGCISAPSQENIAAQLARARTLRQKGSFAEARGIYEAILPKLKAQKASGELGDTLIGLSKIANLEGHYDLAVARAHEAAEVFRGLGDKDGEVRAGNDAGLAYMNSGKYPEAAHELDMALNLNSQTGNAETAITILNDLGSVYFYQSKYAESFGAYDAAMRRLEKSSGEPWANHRRQFTLMNLGALYQKLGNYQRALAISHEVEQSPGLTNGNLGHLHANLGVLYRRLGDPEKALDEYRKAEHFYGLEHDVDGELGVLKNTGIVLALDLGRLKDALKTFTAARALAEKTKNRREAMQALLYRAETMYRMERFAEAKEQFEAALVEAGKLGTVEEKWKALYALGKIAERLDDPSLAEARYHDAVDTIESMRAKIQLSRLRSDFLADKRDVYDAMIRLLLGRNDTGAAFEYMERSRARVFQDNLNDEKLLAGATSLRPTQSRLDPATILIEFWVGPDTISAVWLTRDSAGIAQHHVSPAEMQDLMRLVGNLPESLKEDWRVEVDKLNAFMPEELAWLWNDRYPHILIVPDNLLSLIPFELTPTASGQLLLEKHDVTYLPSAMLLARGPDAQSEHFQFPWRRQLTAFGNPAMVAGRSGLLVSAYEQEEGALLGSAEEIEQIARMSTGRTQTFLGLADRKQSFFEAIHPNPTLLHFSTHAVADMDNPERSRLLFSPDQPGQPNNYLFLKELYDLDLRGVSLAALSACDTERGRMVPGEGVQAFSRALLASGSRSTLTTLWRVPDEPSADFMRQFYFFLLKEHKPKAEALRLAKLEFLHSKNALSHPRFWAAFVLNGDGAKPVPRFIPWQMLLMPVPILALALLFFGMWLQAQRRTRTTRAAATERKQSGAL
jgi:CHAT domain-containing protein